MPIVYLWTKGAELLQRLSIKLGDSSDIVKQRIVALQTVSLTETALFWIATLMASWLIIFDVHDPALPVSLITDESLWAVVFSASALIHLAGLLFNSISLRIIAAHIYALLWFAFSIITIYTRVGSLGAPVFPALTVTSILLAVRLDKMQKDKTK